MMKFIVAANVALIAVLSIANATAQVSTHILRQWSQGYCERRPSGTRGDLTSLV